MVKQAAKIAAIALSLTAFGDFAKAQSALDGDLRTQQETLFQAMLQEPDNLEIMCDHALTLNQM